MSNNDNGIVKWITDCNEYSFWTYADYIKPYIIKFLKDIFPGKVVVRELNNIDLSIPEENLPIEIQATVVFKTRDNQPAYSDFEQKIEKGIIQNITNYDKCWFFFDSELHRAMKNATRGMNINMVWFRNYMKEEKLKVFTVSYDGIIEEKNYSDFIFLEDVSQTSVIKTDDMILNDNKMKIYHNVRKMYDFTQSEIDKFYDNWREYCRVNSLNSINDKSDKFSRFLGKQKDERAKLYSYVLDAIGDLPAINDIPESKNYKQRAKFRASILGIFDIDQRGQNSTTMFIDRANICQYLPCFVRNKEIWDRLKGHSLYQRQFENIIKNGIGQYFDYEERSNQNNVDIKSERTNDKDTNITESKDKIIVNIQNPVDQLQIQFANRMRLTITKDKTKQKNLEDAWDY